MVVREMSATIGHLRERIRLMRPVRSRSEQGTPEVTYAEIATVSAAARAARGNEIVEAGRVQGAVATTFEIRYRADVAADWRIKWRPFQADEEREFEVVSATDPDNRRRRTVIVATEIRR